MIMVIWVTLYCFGLEWKTSNISSLSILIGVEIFYRPFIRMKDLFSAPIL